MFVFFVFSESSSGPSASKFEVSSLGSALSFLKSFELLLVLVDLPFSDGYSEKGSLFSSKSLTS